MNLYKMDCHAVTDVGRQRTENEDHFLIADLVRAVRIQATSLSYDDRAEVSGRSQGKILLVADGMGGHAAGRRASTLAVDETINFMVNRMQWFSFSQQTSNPEDPKTLSADLVNAIKHCQQRIEREAQWKPERRGMGTTLTVAVIDWPTLHVVHVGDSRCYIAHGDGLEQLTRDHTMAQALVDLGRRNEEELEGSQLSNTLWNVVGGTSGDLEPEVYHAELSLGDSLLLCSDGLTKHVSDAEIADVLRSGLRAKEVCHELVDRANAAGGSDNTTVLVATFCESTGDEIQHAAACAEEPSPDAEHHVEVVESNSSPEAPVKSRPDQTK